MAEQRVEPQTILQSYPKVWVFNEEEGRFVLEPQIEFTLEDIKAWNQLAKEWSDD